MQQRPALTAVSTNAFCIFNSAPGFSVGGGVLADIYARFFQKIEIVDKSGATKYNAISLVPKNGNYGLKKFSDNEEIREISFNGGIE